MKVNVLIASHNRKRKTISCLRILRDQRGLKPGIKVKIFLFDDGSIDGTVSEVKKDKLVDFIQMGDGSYFWCGAMRKLIQCVNGSKDDFYLLLNDDTRLRKNAISILLKTWEWVKSNSGKNPIIVGATRAKDRMVTTYSGFKKSSIWHPFRFELINPGKIPKQCLTFNGNCVFVPWAVLQELGGLDSHFTHSFGDIDLGLRASKAGVPIWLAPFYIGVCDRNSKAKKGATIKERWVKLCSPKGLPPIEHLYFCQRHGGVFWPLFWLGPIIKALFP